MNIIIESTDGLLMEIGDKTDIRLMEYPDFGCPQSLFKTDKIPQKDGEVFYSSSLSSRDIILKVEMGVPLYLVSRILIPGTEITLLIDGMWKICGRISGIKEFSRPVRLAKPIITIAIRCFDPYFTKINGTNCVSFSNSGGGLYNDGNYTCQKLTLYNEGDVPCPINVTMCSTATSQSMTAGLFNFLDWNSGRPIYTGLVLKNGIKSGVTHFFTTDIFSSRFFESRSILGECDYFLLPPGETVLYAQNVEGTLCFEPKFLYVDGREI